MAANRAHGALLQVEIGAGISRMNPLPNRPFTPTSPSPACGRGLGRGLCLVPSDVGASPSST